ncbi:ABC transporter ATP-binding protein [Ancylobacter sp. A5.8]|uniref:ABC transporter ATP-binding protein n=1 Tax=Ancylobacter gelatini TaxID=2919920 RepID=UPI001F4D9FB1|nr:ABC transporter ATP-binding protein [Ancylobacter gelatini]MCJ8144194.1 ABC transporter ATP-binding protein [Ancylobacter gelatini]
MSEIRIDIREKRFAAVAGGPERLVFRDFRLEVRDREFLVLLGASGLGKTTLLNIVAGLDTAFTGRVNFSGTKPRIGYAFQNPRLLPWRTVLENVALPLPEGEAGRASALAMLAEVGLADLAGAYPERLSLGQQRRVALARAFVIAPDLLLMDEPFVSLDEANAFRLRELLRALLERHPATVMFVTHDRREALEVATRIVTLEGTPARIARDVPVDPAVRFDAIRRGTVKKAAP